MNWNSSTDSLILMNEPEKIISLLTAFFSPRTIEQNVLRAVSRLASLNFYRLAYNDISKVKSKITNEKIN